VRDTGPGGRKGSPAYRCRGTASRCVLARRIAHEEAQALEELAARRMGPFLDVVQVEGLGKDVHLEVKVEGRKAAFSVSDGTRTVTTSRTVEHLTDSDC